MKLTRSFSLIIVCCVLTITCLVSCNNFLFQDKSTVSIELPANLYEILCEKEIANRAVSGNAVFVLEATMSGSVNQSQTIEITKSNEPYTVVFADVPFNSVITVELKISIKNTVLYSGKSAATIVSNPNCTIDITMSSFLLGNFVLDGHEYAKTSEKVIITRATTITGSASSWNSYYSSSQNPAVYFGTFFMSRNVTLSPFIMGRYEVTQELYQAVMGKNPSTFLGDPAAGETQKLRPADNVSWYDAVIFCNELTKKTMSESDCVYEINDIKYYGDIIRTATVTANHNKKGYRLPTEAEWEFAARGGDPSATEWGYAYAGAQTQHTGTLLSGQDSDSGLEDYGWYRGNSANKTHEVGTKKPNTIGLYDMCGNLSEWCYDRYVANLGIGNVTDPMGPDLGSGRICRPVYYDSTPSTCTVSYREDWGESIAGAQSGFRVCRSIR